MIVAEAQIVSAMQFFEAKHVAEVGRLDRVNLPKPVSQLADLLGAMWFARETEAMLPDTGTLAGLLREAINTDTAATELPTQAGPQPELEIASPSAEAAPLQADEAPLPARPPRDNADVTCEACQ